MKILKKLFWTIWIIIDAAVCAGLLIIAVAIKNTLEQRTMKKRLDKIK